ncbi:hypothetical protein KCP74_02515 [Salmonella enterica subsp. enterica]|nr:hypothetical protein KCP74_02515 [Salmonella enterica subsp. enterica]
MALASAATHRDGNHTWQILRKTCGYDVTCGDSGGKLAALTGGWRWAASMGGMTALGIMTRRERVKCGADLMGVGLFYRSADAFPPLSPQNPAQQAESVSHRAAT